MSKKEAITRSDLERIRLDLSTELKKMNQKQREEYLRAAGQVYSGLAKMARIRSGNGGTKDLRSAGR